MNNKDLKLDEAIKRAEKGEFPEHWLQLYIRDNYKKLGFNSIEGPFVTGYDFKGVYKGKNVIVEAERRPGEFVKHGHNPKEVDILIILSNGDDGHRIRGMTREEWEKYLPKKIIKVDQEDFVKSTYEIRKGYAIEKQKERDEFMKSLSEGEKEDVKSFDSHLSIKKQKEILLNLELLPFHKIKKAFGTLWGLLIEELPNKGTLEAEAFDEALDFTAFEYIKIEKLRKKSWLTRIEFLALANDLAKSRKEFNDLTSEEKEFLEDWLEVLRTEYCSRI